MKVKKKRKGEWQKLSSHHTLCSMTRNAFKTLLAYNLLETRSRCSKMQKSLWMNQENYNKVAPEVSSNNTIIVFLNFIYLFWVCSIFIAVQAFLSLWCLGFSLQWCTCYGGHVGFNSCSVWAQQLRFLGSRAQAQQLWHTGLVALWHVWSSQTGDQTHVSCIGRRICNHWAIREAQQCSNLILHHFTRVHVAFHKEYISWSCQLSERSDSIFILQTIKLRFREPSFLPNIK